MSGSPCESRLAVVAAVLGELGHEIESLGAALCRDGATAARHARELQAIDLIAQTQHALAELIAAGVSDRAVEAVGLDDLRRRLADAVPEDPRMAEQSDAAAGAPASHSPSA